jgi:hypothetical protein
MNAMLNFAVTAISPLPHLLQAMRALYPPQCVVHVGIGQGMGELVEWRNWADLPRAVLIDSDDTRLVWARHGHPNTWRVLHTTVAPTEGKHVYYRASNPQEDGLVPPEQLKPWWPQLTTLGTDTRRAQTLDHIMQMTGTNAGTDAGVEAGTDAAQPATSDTPGHWLLLDCLPAAQLLRGASALLAHTSVVCARTSQAPTDSAAPLADTGHQALIDLLAPQGFVLLGQTETHHPALGYTIMARQPAALLAQAQAAAAAAAALAQAAQQPAAPAADPVSEREAMAAQLVELVTGEKAGAPSLNPSALQAENDALHQRLALLQEELLRAEGQINLIKDLMLRDQEL